MDVRQRPTLRVLQQWAKLRVLEQRAKLRLLRRRAGTNGEPTGGELKYKTSPLF